MPIAIGSPIADAETAFWSSRSPNGRPASSRSATTSEASALANSSATTAATNANHLICRRSRPRARRKRVTRERAAARKHGPSSTLAPPSTLPGMCAAAAIPNGLSNPGELRSGPGVNAAERTASTITVPQP